ncbi:type VI secretion protein [Streptomyces sp. NPDC051940]|uniref:type VI secretion protein n=1 Tax=Streptomyces sp. NPDC051940 TaxID=3155675 RepID=UPI003417191A
MAVPRETSSSERGIPDALLIGVIAFLLGLTVLVWTATGLAGLLAHGSWPPGVTFARTPAAMRELMQEPHDLAGAWPRTPAAALSGWGLFWGVFIGQLLVLLVLTVASMTRVARWRADRADRRADRLAAAEEERRRRRNGRGSAKRPSGDSRHDEPQPPGADGDQVGTVTGGVWAGASPAPKARGGAAGEREPLTPQDDEAPKARGGAASEREPLTTHREEARPEAEPATPNGPLIYQRTRDTTPAREALTAAEGAALVVTSDPTLWSETKDARAKLGPTLVYDPNHRCDTPDRIRWSPTEGCTDRQVADARAAALLYAITPRARADAAIADTARTLLTSWLHAAAVDNRPMAHIQRWAAAQGAAHEPVKILRTARRAAEGSAGRLESALTAHPTTRDQAQQLVTRALSALSTLHIRNSCIANRTDSLTLESFIDEGGTLYVVGEAIEDPRREPGAMPLLTALAADVVEHGRRMAARSSTGRLDPPLTLVLDDVAAVAPVPQLPQLLTARPLPLLAVVRSPEQAQDRWPELGAGS